MNRLISVFLFALVASACAQLGGDGENPDPLAVNDNEGDLMPPDFENIDLPPIDTIPDVIDNGELIFDEQPLEDPVIIMEGPDFIAPIDGEPEFVLDSEPEALPAEGPEAIVPLEEGEVIEDELIDTPIVIAPPPTNPRKVIAANPNTQAGGKRKHLRCFPVEKH